MRRSALIRKWLFCYFVSLIIGVIFAKEVLAYDAQTLYLKGLDVGIRINEDTSLELEEKLLLNFPENYGKDTFEWNISKRYKSKDLNLRRSLKVNSVQGANGINYKYNVDQGLDNARLQIRSDGKFSGENAIKITYTLSKYVDEGVDYDKISWPVLGENINIPIAYVNVVINSPFAEIVEGECLAGDIKASQRMCIREFDKNQARFYSTANLGEGKDFVYTVGIRKDSSLKYPNKNEKLIQILRNNIEKILIGSLLITAVLVFVTWFFKRRKISIRIRKRT